VGGARTKNGGFQVSCSQPVEKKFYCKPILPIESVRSETMPFWLNPPDINNLKRGTSNPKQFSGSGNSFHPSYPTKFVEFNSENIL